MLIKLKLTQERPWTTSFYERDYPEYENSDMNVYINTNMVSNILQHYGFKKISGKLQKVLFYSVYVSGEGEYIAIIDHDEWLKLEEAVNNG